MTTLPLPERLRAIALLPLKESPLTFKQLSRLNTAFPPSVLRAYLREGMDEGRIEQVASSVGLQYRLKG